MMSYLGNWFGQYVEPASVIISLILAIPVFWTWWEVTIGKRRQHRKWLHAVKEEPGRNPSVLIVDIPKDSPGRSIKTQVERYRSNHAELALIPSDRIFHIQFGGSLKPDDMARVQREIRKAACEIYAAGTDVLHYFHQGPVSSAAMVGAEFANACQVNMYQWDQNTYQPWGPLSHRSQN